MIDHETGDPELSAAFEALEPDAPARQRMEGTVLAAHRRAHRPLALEWVELLQVEPANGALILAAAAVTLVMATPVGALLALFGWLS